MFKRARESFTRAKTNKGYYSFLTVDGLFNAGSTIATLSLVSLPISLVAAGVAFTANVGIGLAAGRKRLPVTEPEIPEDEKEPAPKGAVNKAKAGLRGIANYYGTTLKDYKFVTGSASAAAGVTIMFQALWGIHTIATTQSLFFLGGMTGLAATGGIAACGLGVLYAVNCMFNGNYEKWKAISRFFGARRNGEPEAKSGPETPRFPRLQKIIKNNKVVKANKSMMVVATAETSIFALTAAPLAFVRHAAALVAAPQTFLAHAPAMAVALYWVAYPALNIFSAGKMVVKDIFRKGKPADNAKKAIEDVTQSFTPPEDAAAPAENALKDQKLLTDAFDEKAGKKPKAPPAEKPAAKAKAAAPKTK